MECFIIGKGFDIRNRFLKFGNVGYSCNWYTTAPGILMSSNNNIFFSGPQETNISMSYFGFTDGKLNTPNTFLNINGLNVEKLSNGTSGSDIITSFK